MLFDTPSRKRVVAPLITVIQLAMLATMAMGCSKNSKPKGKKNECQQSVCRDCDCDTICDIHEGVGKSSTCDDPDGTDVDTDEDGTPDYLDLNSDNDKLTDREEAEDDDPATEPCPKDALVCAFRDPDYPDRQKRDSGFIDPHADSGVMDSSAGDGGTANGDTDAQQDSGDIVTTECPPDKILPMGYIMGLNEEEENWSGRYCDGLDNDNNNKVDEGCHCGQPGSVQSCFLGPPGRREQGACQDGIQICHAVDEFTSQWGPCQEGISPAEEACDSLDNDCNGCVDEVKDCHATVKCPGPGDVPDAQPFTTYTLNSTEIYPPEKVIKWHWEILGTPCDRLFQSIDKSRATSTSGLLSYTLKDANKPVATVDFTLSGNYQVTLTASKDDGETFTCSYIVKVQAPGLRVELCWDKTGRIATSQNSGVDLDLHLGRSGGTSAWFSGSDCYWNTCLSANTPWNYPNTNDLEQCTGENSPRYDAYSLLDYCPNPRLDIDNKDLTNNRYITENINLDNPRDGDQFRVMVNYCANKKSTLTCVNMQANNDDAGVALTDVIETHPLVNVYCNGELKGSYGAEPNPVEGFDTPGQMWRVVDIVTRGRAATECTLTPIIPTDSDILHDIGDYDPTY